LHILKCNCCIKLNSNSSFISKIKRVSRDVRCARIVFFLPFFFQQRGLVDFELTFSSEFTYFIELRFETLLYNQKGRFVQAGWTGFWDEPGTTCYFYFLFWHASHFPGYFPSHPGKCSTHSGIWNGTRNLEDHSFQQFPTSNDYHSVQQIILFYYP